MTDSARRWTTTNLARLSAAWAAHELAQRAAAVAATAAGSLEHRPGELAELGEALEDVQREATAAAVVAERVEGASWDQIGDALQVTRQAAQKRFGKWEEQFRIAVALPRSARRHVAAVSEVLGDPDRYAGWLARPADGERPGIDEARLPDAFGVDERRFVTSEIANVARLASMIAGRELPAGVDELAARLELQDRKIALYEIQLALDPGSYADDGQTREALSEARIVRDHVLEQLGDVGAGRYAGRRSPDGGDA